MKYFSLSFKPEKVDYEFYYKDFKKGLLFNQMKKSLFSIIFLLTIFIFTSYGESTTLAFPVVFVFIASIFMPLVYSKKMSFFLLESRQLKKENVYDFYSDHIEIRIGADESSKCTTEKHLKMSGFTAVTESKTNFYFSYMNEKMMIIPKRVLNEETYGMIRNLIDNYFSNVYMTI